MGVLRASVLKTMAVEVAGMLRTLRADMYKRHLIRVSRAQRINKVVAQKQNDSNPCPPFAAPQRCHLDKFLIFNYKLIECACAYTLILDVLPCALKLLSAIFLTHVLVLVV